MFCLPRFSSVSVWWDVLGGGGCCGIERCTTSLRLGEPTAGQPVDLHAAVRGSEVTQTDLGVSLKTDSAFSHRVNAIVGTRLQWEGIKKHGRSLAQLGPVPLSPAWPTGLNNKEILNGLDGSYGEESWLLNSVCSSLHTQVVASPQKPLVSTRCTYPKVNISL